jgi:peptide/nickel transport system permease protein
MLAFISRRLILAVLTIWAVSILAFAVIQLPPGDAVDRYIELLEEGGTGLAGGVNMGSFEEAAKMAQELREYYGMDKPFYVRYGKWVWNMHKLDFGYSYLRRGTSGASQIKVTELVQDRLWMTLVLTAATVVFTFIVAFPIGIYSAMRQNTVGDYTATFVGFIGLSVPDFLLCIILMYIFFKYFDQSVGGLFSPEVEYEPWGLTKVLDLLNHLIIPCIVLGTAGTAGQVRILRNNLLDELGKPYVITARSKGLSHWRAVMKYPLRIAINPMISGIGQLLPSLIGGSVIISVILSLPTLGPILLSSITGQDVYAGGFIVLMLGVLTVIGVLISDIMLAIIDPRIRMWESGRGGHPQ